ncbi:Uncharacterised protein [uncultured archaeon]|nr:Uncharacterised protein [uncultured archaeon]
MNLSVIAIEMLKLLKTSVRSFAVMKFITSGWSTRSIPMLAPRRLPPCLITSVPVSNTRMKETGPLATPPVERTTSPLGRSLLNAKPVPPPLW